MMKRLQQKFRTFLKDESGLTTVEYAVAGSLIALAVITAFGNLGTTVGNIISSINTNLGG